MDLAFFVTSELRQFSVSPSECGGPGEIRTHDLFHAMEEAPMTLGLRSLKTQAVDGS
jgi:hypothetical protein